MDRHVIDALVGRTVTIVLNSPNFRERTGQITGYDDLYIVLHTTDNEDRIIPHISISCIKNRISE